MDTDDLMLRDDAPGEFDPLVVEEFGRLLMRRADAPVWRDDRFLEWLAADLRAGDERRHLESDEEFVRRGDELLARIQAHAHRIRRRYRPTPTSRDNPKGIGVVELGVAAGAGRELWDEPTETWIELPEDLPRGRYVALRIVGHSMAPLLHTGDVVLVRRGARVVPNSVVVARNPDNGYVCKRVKRLTPKYIELDSLAPDGPALAIPRRDELIAGTVSDVWCTHRKE